MATRRQPATLTKTAPARPTAVSAPRPAATRTQHLLEREGVRRGERSEQELRAAQPREWRDLQIAVAVGLAAFVLYGFSAARYPVTGDTPELIAVANIWGVAHAPGYPLLTVTAHIFGWLPIGSYSLRMSLYSAACSSACVGVVYSTIRRLSPSRSAAIAGSAALALTPVFWQWSVVFEVFALADLLAATIAYLLVRWYQDPERRGFLVGAAFTFGLALTNQQTIIFVAPAIVVLLVYRRRELRRSPQVLLYAPLALVAGLLPYLYVPIASSADPALNWGDVHSAGNLVDLLTRADYGGGSHLTLIGSGALSGGNPLLRMGQLALAIGVVVGVLAIAGLGYAWREHRWYFWFVVTGFGFSGLIMQFVADVNLSQSAGLFVLERFFLLPLVFIAPLAGLGVVQLAELTERSKGRLVPATQMVAVLAVIVASIIAALNYSQVDLSNDRVADLYARDILNGLPKNDILLAQGDESIGPLWAVQHVEHIRPDVTLVSSDVFPAPWYQQDLRTQGLSVPRASTVLAFRSANADRPVNVIGNLPDKSLDGKYFYYQDGLTNDLLPESANPTPQMLAQDNTTKLASYHIPSYRQIKQRSFEPNILADYAAVPFAVGEQFRQAGDKADAAAWYKRALAIDPSLTAAKNELATVEK